MLQIINNFISGAHIHDHDRAKFSHSNVTLIASLLLNNLTGVNISALVCASHSQLVHVCVHICVCVCVSVFVCALQSTKLTWHSVY